MRCVFNYLSRGIVVLLVIGFHSGVFAEEEGKVLSNQEATEAYSITAVTPLSYLPVPPDKTGFLWPRISNGSTVPLKLVISMLDSQIVPGLSVIVQWRSGGQFHAATLTPGNSVSIALDEHSNAVQFINRREGTPTPVVHVYGPLP